MTTKKSTLYTNEDTSQSDNYIIIVHEDSPEYL